MKFFYLFTDFITTESINNDTKYFIECSHSSMLMGELIVDYLIKQSNNYGKEITSDNMYSHIKENEKALINWKIKQILDGSNTRNFA